MTQSVSYKTTVTGITAVRLDGEVCYDLDLECYTVGGDSVEYWLERISSQSDAYVYLEIKVHDGKEDDSDLIATDN